MLFFWIMGLDLDSLPGVWFGLVWSWAERSNGIGVAIAIGGNTDWVFGLLALLGSVDLCVCNLYCLLC